jgi:hypothetical protein
MHAMVGMGMRICQQVRAKARRTWPRFMRSMTIDTSAARKTGVPGAVSQAKSKTARSGFGGTVGSSCSCGSRLLCWSRNGTWIR